VEYLSHYHTIYVKQCRRILKLQQHIHFPWLLESN